MKKLNLFLVVVAASCCLPVFALPYPGNRNFRNVPATFTATNRTDWVTNILDSTLSQPFDWSKGKQLAPGVTHVPAIFTTEAGWPRRMVCHFVRIDLTTPGLRFTGVDRCPEGWGDPMPEPEAKCKNYPSGYYPKRTVREKTTDFLARARGSKAKGGMERNAVLAWNTAAWLPWTDPNTNVWACPYSPLYSDGIQISNNRTGGVEVPNLKDPAPQVMFVQLKNDVCGMIGSMTEDFAKMTWCCVPAFVTGLVDGKWNALDNGDISPRTAIGISQDGKTFYLLVCDGRLGDAWTPGCDFTSLSKLLFGMGAWVGFNLDGGGSSTLCRWDETAGKPEVINRPCYGLRDNGSSMVLYYYEPVAMIGSFFYEDFDVLVQDIADGETDGSGEINVLKDVTFTAEHPCIPSGRFNLWSTNDSTIGWADGVTPTVAAGTIVRFRNIRFREGSRSLSVGTGATTVFYEGVDLDEVSIPNAGGLVIGGVPACPVRVSCATATGVGEVFATSASTLADSAVAAKKFFCAGDETLVAEAFEDGGTVKFKWKKIVTFGEYSGKLVELGRGVVNVNVAECISEYESGYSLKFTVKGEDGLRSATKTVAFTGPGDYSFDTSDSSDPTICSVGYGFDFTIELVDATGTRVPNSEVASGSMGLGVSENWFSASASDNTVEGGSWTTTPSIENSRYAVSEGANLDFAATESKGGRVRYETVLEFKGFITDAFAQQMFASVSSSYSTPHGACFVARGADGSPVWHGLVSENGAPVFKTLYGPAALNTPTKVFCDVDWSSGAARVRYSVAVGDGAETVLADEAGNTWFASVSSASAAAGHVYVTGTGLVDSFAGKSVARAFSYAAWIAERGIAGEPGDKATNDIPNGVRYAFNIDPAKGPSEMGSIINVVFENGKPAVQCSLADGRVGVTLDVLATENLADWSNATLIKMKQGDDGFWKPVASEEPGYIFPSQMFFKYILDFDIK